MYEELGRNMCEIKTCSNFFEIWFGSDTKRCAQEALRRQLGFRLVGFLLVSHSKDLTRFQASEIAGFVDTRLFCDGEAEHMRYDAFSLSCARFCCEL